MFLNILHLRAEEYLGTETTSFTKQKKSSWRERVGIGRRSSRYCYRERESPALVHIFLHQKSQNHFFHKPIASLSLSVLVSLQSFTRRRSVSTSFLGMAGRDILHKMKVLIWLFDSSYYEISLIWSGYPFVVWSWFWLVLVLLWLHIESASLILAVYLFSRWLIWT